MTVIWMIWCDGCGTTKIWDDVHILDSDAVLKPDDWWMEDVATGSHKCPDCWS